MNTDTSSKQGERTFGNEMCDKTFTNKTRLDQHISPIHEGKKPSKYGICDYSPLICFEVDMLTRLPHIGKQIFGNLAFIVRGQ